MFNEAEVGSVSRVALGSLLRYGMGRTRAFPALQHHFELKLDLKPILAEEWATRLSRQL